MKVDVFFLNVISPYNMSIEKPEIWFFSYDNKIKTIYVYNFLLRKQYN